MLTLAMILDNPGEPPHPTRYRDPRVLRDLGYTDLIIYPTTGLSGMLDPHTLAAGDMRNWVAEQYDAVAATADEAARVGMGVYLTCDAPSLARELVGSAMTCIKSNPAVLCPASDELLDMSRQCLDALLDRIDNVRGVVLRLGDNDAAKSLHLVGNDIYTPHCARCSAMGRADRLVKFINHYYDTVVASRSLKLIVRGWNVKPGGMHDNPDLCRRVVQRLPEDDRLIYSFKFTQTDFWRYQRWNPSSLVCGDRPVIYELQCQREFEGKGAMANFQPPLWSTGMTEFPDAVGLRDVAENVNLAGLWAWVRGGGWRGPFIAEGNETWIDANVWAVPKLSENPAADADDLARQWIADSLGFDAPAIADAVFDLLKGSTETARQTFYIDQYARSRHDPWHPSAHFIQDDQIDAEAAWSIVEQLPERVLDEIVAEKMAAEQRIVDARTALQRAAADAQIHLPESITASLDYSESLVRTLRFFLAGLVSYRRCQRKPEPSLADAAIRHMRQTQQAWQHHTQHASTRGAATAFSSDNLFDFTERVIHRLTPSASSVSPDS